MISKQPYVVSFSVISKQPYVVSFSVISKQPYVVSFSVISKYSLKLYRNNQNEYDVLTVSNDR